MQIGIAAYLRNIAVRCNQIGRRSGNDGTQKELGKISEELAEKAELLEEHFRVVHQERP